MSCSLHMHKIKILFGSNSPEQMRYSNLKPITVFLELYMINTYSYKSSVISRRVSFRGRKAMTDKLILDLLVYHLLWNPFWNRANTFIQFSGDLGFCTYQIVQQSLRRYLEGQSQLSLANSHQLPKVIQHMVYRSNLEH